MQLWRISAPRIPEHCKRMLVNEFQVLTALISAVLSRKISWIGAVAGARGSLTSKVLPVFQSHTTILIPSKASGCPNRRASLEFVMDTE
jgi:hypothetical protein